MHSGPVTEVSSDVSDNMNSQSVEKSPLKFRGLFPVIGFLLLFSAVFGLAFTPLRSSQDEWWHLKTGEWIWQHGKLPTNDIFTYTGESLRWYNHEWLSQLAFYSAYSLGGGTEESGIRMLIAFKSLIVGFTFCGVAWLCRIRGAGWALSFLLALIAADVSRRTIYARPPIFSYAFMTGFLLLFAQWKNGKLPVKYLWLMVPLTIFWANFHGMVLLAGAIVGGYCGGEYLENLVGYFKRGRKERGAFFRAVFTNESLNLSALTICVFAAMMIQPSGFHLLFLSKNFTADPMLQQMIAEMLPTPFVWTPNQPLAAWAGFLTPWVLLFVFGLVFIASAGRMRHGADYIIVPFFILQGVMHHRLLPLFAISTVPCIAGMVFLWKKRGILRSEKVSGIAAIGFLAAIAWFNFTVAEPPPQTFFKRNVDLLEGKSFAVGDYPAPLMDFLEQSGFPPRMMSESNYCGYAMWRLSPEKYKLFTDNRFDLFGSKYFKEELVILDAAEKGMEFGSGEVISEGWKELVQRYGIEFFVFRPNDRINLHRALQKDGSWKVVFHYLPPREKLNQTTLGGYVVWLRNVPENSAAAQRAEVYYKKNFPLKPPLDFIQYWTPPGGFR